MIVPKSRYTEMQANGQAQERLQHRVKFRVSLSVKWLQVNSMVKPTVVKFQTEQILPVDASAYGIRRLPIRQTFHELQQCDECQAEGSRR